MVGFGESIRGPQLGIRAGLVLRDLAVTSSMSTQGLSDGKRIVLPLLIANFRCRPCFKGTRGDIGC